jgi:hypothetical protein
MEEISPGLWHWTARHPHHGGEVSSYFLAGERVLIDAMLPPGGPEWFRQRGSEPEHFVLSNRHHDRDAWRFREEFGVEVHCIANGVHELAGRGPVTPFAFSDELPGGLVVHRVNVICPDETALHIVAHRALACADGVVLWPGIAGLTFVPDWLMDEPTQTKQGLRAAYRGLLKLDFDRLLLAHGGPVTTDARAALRAFADEAG